MLRRAHVALMRETRVDDALLRSAECGAPGACHTNYYHM